MKRIYVLSSLKSPGRFLPGLLLFYALLTLAACGKGRVEVDDYAHVLNSASVQGVAAGMSSSLLIYTTNTFEGSQSAFRQEAIQQLQGDSARVILAIDTKHRYLSITRGSDVALSSAAITQAEQAFVAKFQHDDYTTATLAALHSLQNSLKESPAPASNDGLLSSPLSLCCCVLPLLLTLFAILFSAGRRAHLGGSTTLPGSGLFGMGTTPFPRPGREKE